MMNHPGFQSAMKGVSRILAGRYRWWLGALLLVLPLAASAATNNLTWDREKNVVSADVRDWDLIGLMESVAAQSGWQVYLEPDYSYKASVKFKDLPPGEALRRLLGSLNFAMVPQTNGPQRLYVFRTAMKNATQQVRKAGERTAPKPKRVTNELIVRVKPGTNIEALAKSLGAEVVGSIPELNAYRLEFEDEAAAEAARQKLLANPDVVRVEDSYMSEMPMQPQSLGGYTAPETKLTLDPPKTDDCKVVVGFVDTTLPRLDPTLEAFVKDRISVAGSSATASTTPSHSVAMWNAFLQAVAAQSNQSGKTSTSLQGVFVDVFGTNTSANNFNVALGLITAGNNGATVINASLGGYGDSPILRDAVEQLALHNIPVFAAVGNDGSNVPFYPAAYPGVVSVTALTRAGQIATYANTGTQADAAAPGAVIFSYNGLVYGSQGTSVSSAVAAGMAAGLADSTCAPWTKVIPVVEKALAVPASQ